MDKTILDLFIEKYNMKHVSTEEIHEYDKPSKILVFKNSDSFFTDIETINGFIHLFIDEVRFDSVFKEVCFAESGTDKLSIPLEDWISFII